MKKIYVIKKYVQADSVLEALKKEKKVEPSDVWLTDYSTAQHLEDISPRPSHEKKG